MVSSAKKITIIWYSQTGHSFTCAKTAENILAESGHSVMLKSIYTKDERIFDTDVYLFVLPVFSFTVPVALKNFIAGMPKHQTKKTALAIITCAGLPANTPTVLSQLLAKKNIELASNIIIRSRESYIPFAKWFGLINKKDKPNKDSFKEIEKYLKGHLISKLKYKRAWFNPLDILHWFGKVAPDDTPKWFLGSRTFHDERCTKCGYCVSLCPTDAIKFKKGVMVYSDHECIGCCGCINICPENAWELLWFDQKFYNKGLNIREMVKTCRK